MWSAGCIVAELFSRQPLFQGTDPVNQLEQVVRLIGAPSEEVCAPAHQRAVREHLSLSLSLYHNASPNPRPHTPQDLEAVMNERALKLLEDLAASPEGSQASLASTLHKAPPHALDLIRRMLTFNMTKRITAEAALTHPFIKLTGEAQTAEQLAASVKAWVPPPPLPEQQNAEPGLLSEWLAITGVATLQMEQLQNLIFQEMLYFHPEAIHLDWGAAKP